MPKTKEYVRLTHNFVRSVATEGRYGDGRGGLGLSLLVKRTANGRWSKTWSQRIRVKGKVAMLGMGSFPSVSLAMARDKALDNARRVESGEDIRKPPPTVPTVDEAFDRVIKGREKSWKGRASLERWRRVKVLCKPLGSMPVSEVTPRDILDLITPLWHEKTHTARDLRGKLSIVMEWSITEGFRKDSNPARPSVASSLGKQEPVTHHKSLPPSQLGSALALIRDSGGWWAKRYCLIFISITGVRNVEGREATWDEIDLDTSTWTIPASRMKAEKEHIVPLSTQAKEILAYARRYGESDHGTIFPPEARRAVHGQQKVDRNPAQPGDTGGAARVEVQLHKLGGLEDAHTGGGGRDGPSPHPRQGSQEVLPHERLFRVSGPRHAGVGRLPERDHGAGRHGAGDAGRGPGRHGAGDAGRGPGDAGPRTRSGPRLGPSPRPRPRRGERQAAAPRSARPRATVGGWPWAHPGRNSRWELEWAELGDRHNHVIISITAQGLSPQARGSTDGRRHGRHGPEAPPQERGSTARWTQPTARHDPAPPQARGIYPLLINETVRSKWHPRRRGDLPHWLPLLLNPTAAPPQARGSTGQAPRSTRPRARHPRRRGDLPC